jgi:hypothetical protein
MFGYFVNKTCHVIELQIILDGTCPNKMLFINVEYFSKVSRMIISLLFALRISLGRDLQQ